VAASRLQVRLDQQVTADVVVAEQADDLAVAHNGQALVTFGHHRLVRFRQPRVRRQRGQFGVHRFADRHVGAEPVGGVEHVLSGDDAEETVAVHDGEIILAGVIDHFEAAHDGGGRGEHDEIARHDFLDFEVAQQAAGAHDFFLALRADEDEDADDDEPEGELQSDQHEHDGQPLPHRRGDDRGARERHHQRQQRAEQASAIHREGGDEVEEEQREVGVDDRGEKTVNVVWHRDQEQVRRQARERHQRGGDDEVDGRPGERDGDFVPRFFGNTFQGRDAADGQQRDAADLNAEALGDEAVAEFVEHDTGEDGRDQRQRPRRAARPHLDKAGVGDQPKQQQQRDVQVQADARHAPDFQRPTHTLRLAQPSRRCKMTRLPLSSAPWKRF